MKRLLLFLFISFVLVGILSACLVEQSPIQSDQEVQHNSEEADSFQEYLWEEHTIDLFIQIGLLLAGALGVAALLPASDEE